MKVAITAKSPSLESEIDPRFGRAAHIIIVDTETLHFDAVDNSANYNAFKGAGIQAAAMISEKGAEVLCTGYCGPKAFTTLAAAEIKVVSDCTGTVQQMIERIQQGDFTYTDSANAEAHW